MGLGLMRISDCILFLEGDGGYGWIILRWKF